MRYSMIYRLFVGATLVAATALPATAAELVGAPPLSSQNGLQADFSSGSLQQSFTSSLSGTVESIVWWGFHGADSGGESYDNFIVSLGGADQTGSLSLSSAGNGVTRYELDIVDIALVAGDASTLDILNDSEDVEWYWQYSTEDPQTMAFSLQGTATSIPEPATYALILLALAGMATCRQRKPT